ncbi:14288_t:CDS:2, partial [Acaulospora morrowiae]
DIVYEEENVKKKEGYYMKELCSNSDSNNDICSEPHSDSKFDDGTRSEGSSPAQRRRNARQDDRKIESEGERTEKVALIEKLPMLMETTQEQRIEEKIEMLKTDNELN